MRFVVLRLFCVTDKVLPEAATCVFKLSLPQYTSADILRRQLLFAVRHCQDYDQDGGARGVAVAPNPRNVVSVDNSSDAPSGTGYGFNSWV